MLAKFRLGDIDLGLRDSPPVLNCPCCTTGPNNAMHLVFDCNTIKSKCNTKVLEEALVSKLYSSDDPCKLQSFLGGDFSPVNTLMERADYLINIMQVYSDAQTTTQ